MVSPRMNKAFSNSINLSVGPEQILKKLELASTTNADNIPDGKEFVVALRDGNHFKLLSAEYLRKHPNGMMCPVVELVVDESETGEGSTMGYKIDIDKNLISMITISVSTLAFIAAFIWFVCSIFVSINVIGIILGGLLTGVSGVLLTKKAIVPTFKMLMALDTLVRNN